MTSCKPIAFESSRVKEASRQEIRDARERVLSRAKDDHDWKERKKEQARMRGDDKWMLPSLEARLSSDKKHKKKKKKHKKKHKRKSSSESERSSDEDEKWVEKPSEKSSSSTAKEASISVPTTEPKAERDEWMTLSGIIPCTTRNELRQSSRAAKEEEKKKQNSILDNAGQSARELNPYWQDGGSGLPQAPDTQEVKLAEKTVGDQGVGWLRKALQRIQEQAEETGRDPEDIAAERWGSLSKLKSLLAEAEGRSRQSPDRHRDTRHRDDRRSYDKFRSRDSRDKSYEDRHKGRSFHRPRDEYEDRYKSRHSRDDSRNNRDDNKSSIKGKFMKPSEDDSERSNFVHRSSGSRNWQKKEAKVEPVPVKREPAPKEEKKSSSSSSSDEDEPEETETILLLTDKEMNDIGAKIVKAEIFGNETLAKELKSQLEAARAAREAAKAAGITAQSSKSSKEEDVVILTRTDSRGMTRPLEAPQYQEPSGGRRKKQKVDTHNKQGERERYFPDDDKYRLQDMFTQEKLNSVEDSNYEFAKLIGKGASRVDKGEGDLDEMFEESARYKESDGKIQRREREQAVKEHKKVSRALEGCRRCVDSKQMLKHLIIALGSKVYLSLPPYKSLTPGHCLLAPTLHTPCATQLDEDVWAEMQTFRKTLTKMFADKGQDVVFFETARNLHNFPHMVMECVPLDQDSGSLAPIYFKKAIQECETEWSTNKKLVELAGKGLRRAIPKGLPYFAVNFGNDDGFGHVIEDDKLFPQNFAQEIIGGMLDLEHHLWRKQHNENFDAQRRKVLEFAKDWSAYDFTQKKTKDTSSSSSDSD